MNNRRGQSLGLGIISAVFIFIVGILFINFIMPEVSTARVELDCANAAGISDGVKLTCLAISSTVPYWIILIFSLAIGFITARMFG